LKRPVGTLNGSATQESSGEKKKKPWQIDHKCNTRGELLSGQKRIFSQEPRLARTAKKNQENKSSRKKKKLIGHLETETLN